MNNKKNFEKPPLSIEKQLELLSSRGLMINDKKLAEHYLNFISYYRFCGYAIEYENTETNSNSVKRYINGVTFDQVFDCYVFDRKLRLLIIDAVEKIEIAVRTVISNELALKYDAHWYMNKSLFLRKHDELIKTIEKETRYQLIDYTTGLQKRESFIHHYFSNYSQPHLPAIWMVAEVLSFGAWSMIFSNLRHREDQKIICRHFGIDYVVMTSWLHALTHLRNLCAHHRKLWSRSFIIKPITAKKFAHLSIDNATFAAHAVVIKILLHVISPDNKFCLHLFQLLQEHPNINIEKMGLTRNWHHEPFWGIKNST